MTEPPAPSGTAHDVDVLVVGSGFGGSVAALRLTEKGYRVRVLEAGRRFTPETLPRTSWDLRSFLWAPRLGLRGMQRITLLDDVVVLSAAGVGGGSLVYANTLYEPPREFFEDPQWAGITDWQAELAPHYDTARRVLGVVTTPHDTPSDRAMREVAERMGVADTFRPTPVGVFFGRPGVTVPDPYFGGAGPDRTGCTACGDCMIGCRVGAKNRLDLNYLWLAERGGAVVTPDSTVDALHPLAGGGFRVEGHRTARRRERFAVSAGQVVLAAGTLGTQRLLHDMRDSGVLPEVSERLGHLTRTNSEAILGATSRRRDVDFSVGVAITSSFHADPRTHLEPVRYGRGSNAMGLLSTLATSGAPGRPRWQQWLRTAARHPGLLARSLWLRGWSERTVIVLVMQSLDNSLRLRVKQGRFGRRLTTEQGHGDPNPTWIPAGEQAVRHLADVIGGDPGGSWGELVDIPMTAHVIGGAVIGETAATGVVDPYHRVHGVPGLHVVDGAAVSANLGVNPSLTITAQAERAFSLWPVAGGEDPRPPLGAPYAVVEPVPPRTPLVPPTAPAALHWPTAPRPGPAAPTATRPAPAAPAAAGGTSAP